MAPSQYASCLGQQWHAETGANTGPVVHMQKAGLRTTLKCWATAIWSQRLEPAYWWGWAIARVAHLASAYHEDTQSGAPSLRDVSPHIDEHCDEDVSVRHPLSPRCEPADWWTLPLLVVWRLGRALPLRVLFVFQQLLLNFVAVFPVSFSLCCPPSLRFPMFLERQKLTN